MASSATAHGVARKEDSSPVGLGDWIIAFLERTRRTCFAGQASKPNIFLHIYRSLSVLSIHSSSINMRFALLLSLAAVSNGAVAPQKSLDEPLDQSTLVKRARPRDAYDSLKAPMIITMERLAQFPGAAASRPRAASFPSLPACERPFYRAHARDSSPAPCSLRGPLAPPRFPREDFLTSYIPSFRLVDIF